MLVKAKALDGEDVSINPESVDFITKEAHMVEGEWESVSVVHMKRKAALIIREPVESLTDRLNGEGETA